MRAKWFVIAGAVLVAGAGAGWWLVSASSDSSDTADTPAVATVATAATPAGAATAEPPAPPKDDGTLRNMEKHWFADLTPEKAGMTPEAFEAAKATSGKLGVPVPVPGGMEIAAFDFVKFASGGTEGTMIQRVGDLLQEAAVQSVATEAPPISWLDAVHLRNEKMDDKLQEIMLPVPAGTTVHLPLVGGRRAASKVRCGGSAHYGEDQKAAIVELTKQVTAAKGEITGMYIRLSRLDKWFEGLKQPGLMTYQVCLTYK